MGIEPTYPAWKAEVLPLNYTRKIWYPKPDSNWHGIIFLWILSPVCLPDFTIWAL